MAREDSKSPGAFEIMGIIIYGLWLREADRSSLDVLDLSAECG